MGRRVRGRPWGEEGSRSRLVVGVGSRGRRLGLGRRGVACRGLCRPFLFFCGCLGCVLEVVVVVCVTEALLWEGVGSGSVVSW